MTEQPPLFWVEDKVAGDSPSPAFASRHPGGSPSHTQVRKLGLVMCQALRHGLDLLSLNDLERAKDFETLKKHLTDEQIFQNHEIEWFGELVYRGRFVALLGRNIERRDLCEVWGESGALRVLGWEPRDAQTFWADFVRRIDAALEQIPNDDMESQP